jgi:hypothetical protein
MASTLRPKGMQVLATIIAKTLAMPGRVERQLHCGAHMGLQLRPMPTNRRDEQLVI